MSQARPKPISTNSLGAIPAGKAVFCEKPVDLDLDRTLDEQGSRNQPFQNFFLDRSAAVYQAEMLHFSEIIKGNREPSVSFEDGAAALALADAALESSRSGQVVRLPERS